MAQKLLADHRIQTADIRISLFHMDNGHLLHFAIDTQAESLQLTININTAHFVIKITAIG